MLGDGAGALALDTAAVVVAGIDVVEIEVTSGVEDGAITLADAKESAQGSSKVKQPTA